MNETWCNNTCNNPTLNTKCNHRCSLDYIEDQICSIVNNVLLDKDDIIRKRNKRKLSRFFNTLKEFHSISLDCISSINQDLLSYEDTHILLRDIFIDAANSWMIREYIMLIEEFRRFFPDINFIYTTPEIQTAIREDIKMLESYWQDITSILSKYLRILN